MGSLVIFLLLFLLLVRSEGGLYFRCPLHPCLCESGDMGLVMNCRQRFLTRIPSVIASDLLFHEISLKKNNIRHLEPQAFKGIKVKKIDLSENIITSIDDDAFDGVEDILEELVIQVYNMKGLPLKALQKLNVLKVLHVIGCKVPILTNATFASMPTVEEIRLNSCGIQEIEPDAFVGIESTLKVLDLFGNNLKTVPSAALIGLDGVEKMVLTGNQLKKIEENSLLGMASLRHLELSSNGIYFIHPMAFEGIQTSLEFLGLQRNRLTANDLIALRILRNLNQLELAYNQIEDIPRRLFHNLNRVTLIGLQSNKIPRINRLTFAGTERKLKVLLLSDNHVNIIAPNTFLGFRCLRHLYLDRTNAGSGLSRHSFKGLAGSLETLNMQRSGFTASGFVAISNLGELKTLVLRDNRITSLLPRVFSKLRRLTRLDLQGNKLQSITNPETFQGLDKSLRQLVLSNNMITTLSECVFEKFEQLRDIVLNQNPLICDCQMLWLKQWVVSKTSTFSRNTLNWICAGPREHAGKLFRAVSNDEMVCSEGSEKVRCPSSEQYPIVSTPHSLTTQVKSSVSPTSDYISTDSNMPDTVPITKMVTQPIDNEANKTGKLNNEPPKMQLLLPNIDDPIFNQDSFYNDIIQKTVQLMASKIDETSHHSRPKPRSRHRFKHPFNKFMTTPGHSRKRTLDRWLSSTRKMYTKPAWTSVWSNSRRNMTTSSLKTLLGGRSTVPFYKDRAYRTSTKIHRTTTLLISTKSASSTVKSTPPTGTSYHTDTNSTNGTTQTEYSVKNDGNSVVTTLKSSKERQISETSNEIEKAFQHISDDDGIENPFVNLTSAAASGRIRSTSHGLKSKDHQQVVPVFQSNQHTGEEEMRRRPESQDLADTTISMIINTTSASLSNTRATSYSTKLTRKNLHNITTKSRSTTMKKASLPEIGNEELSTTVKQSSTDTVVSSEKTTTLSEVSPPSLSKYFNTTDDKTHDNVTYRSKLDEATIVTSSNRQLKPTEVSTTRNSTPTQSHAFDQSEKVTYPSVITRTLERKQTPELLLMSKNITLETSTTENIPNISISNNLAQFNDGSVTHEFNLSSPNRRSRGTGIPVTALSTPVLNVKKDEHSPESLTYPEVTIAYGIEATMKPVINDIENTTVDYQSKLHTRSMSYDNSRNISQGNHNHTSGQELMSTMSSFNSLRDKHVTKSSSIASAAITPITNAIGDNKSYVTNRISKTYIKPFSLETTAVHTDYSTITSAFVPVSTQLLPTTADKFLSMGNLASSQRQKDANTDLLPTEYIIHNADNVNDEQKNGSQSAKSTRFPSPTPAHDPTSVVKPSKPTSLEPDSKIGKGLQKIHQPNEIHNHPEKVLIKSSKDKILELLSNHLTLEAKRTINSSQLSGEPYNEKGDSLLDTMQTTLQRATSRRHNITLGYTTATMSQKTTNDTIASRNILSSNKSTSLDSFSTSSTTAENTNFVTGGIQSTTSVERTVTPQQPIAVSKDSRNPYSKGKVESKHLYTGKPRKMWSDMSVIKNWLNSALAGEVRKYGNISSKTTPTIPAPNHNEGRIKNPYEILRNFKRVNSRLSSSDNSDGLRRKSSVQGRNELTLHTTMPIPSGKTNNLKVQKPDVDIQKDRAGLPDALDETSGTKSLEDNSFTNRDNRGTEETSFQEGSLTQLPNLKPEPLESNRTDRKDQVENNRPSITTNTYIGPWPGNPLPELSATIDQHKNIAGNNTDKLSILLSQTTDTSEISQISTTVSLHMDSANTSSKYSDQSQEKAVLEELLAARNRSKVDRYTIPDFAVFVSVLPYANDAVKVTWNVSHDYAVSGFRVYYGDTKNETLIEGPELGGTVRTYDVTSLVSHEKYTFCVVAYLSETNERKSGQCKEAKIKFVEEHATISSREKTKTLALIIGSYAAGALVLVTLLLAMALLVRRYRDKSKTGLYVPRASPYWIEFLCGGITTSRYSTTVLDSSTATVSSGVEMSENDSHSDSEESGTYSFDYSLRSLPAQHIWSTADLHTNLYTY